MPIEFLSEKEISYQKKLSLVKIREIAIQTA